jgi:hypothetical protein
MTDTREAGCTGAAIGRRCQTAGFCVVPALLAAVLMPVACRGQSTKDFGDKDWLEGALRGQIFFLPAGTPRLPDLSSLHPVGTIYARELDVPTTDWQEGFPGISNRFEWFAIEYTGLIRAHHEGHYALRLVSDDGSKLYVDDKLIIDNDGLHSTRSANGGVDLDDQQHTIRIQYFQGPRYQVALQLYCRAKDGAETLFPNCDLGLVTDVSRTSILALKAFTLFHVALSLVGIGSGFMVVFAMIGSKRLSGWNALFLITTVGTSVTGFLFPFHGFLPSHGVGIVSLIVLTMAILARYRFHLAGGWRRTYAITAVLALYLNFFVLIVQLFLKVPALAAIAPTQSEPPFRKAQLAALVFFVVLGILAAIRFRGEPARTG